MAEPLTAAIGSHIAAAVALLGRAVSGCLLAAIRAYQFLLSPWVGGSCRYWPTCSEYAREAIGRHGAARGSYLAARRLARCHPYGRGGVDAVPEAFAWRCRCEPVAPEHADRAEQADRAQQARQVGQADPARGWAQHPAD